MAALFTLSRFSRSCKYLTTQCNSIKHVRTRSISTIVQPRRTLGILKAVLIGGVIGGSASAIYAYNKDRKEREKDVLVGKEFDTAKLKHKPIVTPSREVVSTVDKTGLKLTLFQYQTCPFCCKVRVLLDYYGISYDVVEVDPVLRKEISWSPYRKVPILLAKVKDGYQPLNDSSVIMSLLASYVNDPSHNIDELLEYYPNIGIRDEEGNFKKEIMNKYFLMYQEQIPKGRSLNDIVEERRWRRWADETLVHALSPNVYRTLSESYETFNWFSDTGKWEEYFPWWEQKIMINVGAFAMWLIAKRLKKRHRLKDNVRQSLYDDVNYWMKNINARGTQFMGGQTPDLSDLTVYGVLKSIEGCSAFKDLLENTKIGVWYDAMNEKVGSHAGNLLINA